MIPPIVRASLIRIVIIAVVVTAMVVAVFVTGWADDRAEPGSRGRGQVTAPASTQSR
jgi:hypothetical protein